MNWLKKIGWALLALIGLTLVAGGIYLNTLKPQYTGELDLPGLETQVEVWYDQHGIPHIYGSSEEDVQRALGYVHAQDRLWQMELLRRIGPGRLSEVFGPDLLKTDKLFVAMGIEEYSKNTVQNIDSSAREIRMSLAYLEGVNHFIKTGPTPVEFVLTGVEKEEYTLEDIYNALGYMAFSFARAHRTDPLLSHVRTELGMDYLMDLPFERDSSKTEIKSYSSELSVDAISGINQNLKALENLPVPQFIGSNSWVIGPDKTKSGKVILANDPHMGYAQPSVWYEAHINSPGYERYGYYLAGVPFPLLGHNKNVAYGLTMFQNDDCEFYLETPDPQNTQQYLTREGPKKYGVNGKTILVKGEESVDFSWLTTENGPVINEVLDPVQNQSPVSMDWIYTSQENKLLLALYGISHAEDLPSFKSALPNIHAPGLNVMYGDKKGHVAWFGTAKLYQYPDSVSTYLYRDGARDARAPERYLDFDENPQAIDPDWGYVYSANNRHAPKNGVTVPGYYLPENRAKRITQLLDANDQWDRAQVETMINDITSPVNPGILKVLIQQLEGMDLSTEQVAFLDQAKQWSGGYEMEDTVPALFHRWVYNSMEAIFLDEMGKENFEVFLQTHLFKKAIAPFLLGKESVWMDDVSTSDKTETLQELVQGAFSKAWSSLEEDLGTPDQWQWSKVHTLEHEHPIGRVKWLRSRFNVGPFPMSGSREVINNIMFPYTADGMYKVNAGPSTRRVIDFGDIENSRSILPTGQSGNPMSPYYKDQAEMYNKGEFRKMLLNKKEIQDSSDSRLQLNPAEN